MMEYKGYLMGPVEMNEEDGTFSGTVIGTRDVIHFEGATASELADAFRDSVDEYLAFCVEQGVEPDRPYSGNVPLRIDPNLHRRAALIAKVQGVSLNQLIADALKDRVA